MKKLSPVRGFIKSVLPENAAAIELTGSRRAVVEDCGGVVEYENERVRLRSGRQILKFTGSALSLESYGGGVAVVTGSISSLSFE